MKKEFIIELGLASEVTKGAISGNFPESNSGAPCPGGLNFSEEGLSPLSCRVG